MNQFILHHQLEADSFFVRDLPLCQLRLNNQKAVPSIILIPRRTNISEIFQLAAHDRTLLIDEITMSSQALETLFAPHKINVGALGNIVPQLHIHIVGRYTTDPAWPGPVWGRLPPAPYLPEDAQRIGDQFNNPLFWA